MPSKKLFLSSTVLIVLITLPLIGSVGASSEMWSRTYGGASSDYAEAMVQTSDGGYALAGYTRSFGAGSYDFWLVKTDEYGVMEWNHTYGGAGIEHAYALVETSDGGYALTGTTKSFGAGKYDFWLVKTDGYGNVEWNQTYGGESNDFAYALVETSDGGFAIAGGASLVKTDAYGNLEWTQTCPVFARSLVETSDGGFAIAGGPGLVKTDAYGNMEWYRTYRGGEAYSLVETSDGGYAIAGDTSILNPEIGIVSDFWLVKTDANGNLEWKQTYSGWRVYSLVETSDGGYALAGGKRSFDTGSDDFWLAKTDEHGVIPEFPSWAVLPLLITATLVIIVCKKRLPKNLSNQQKSFISGA